MSKCKNNWVTQYKAEEERERRRLAAAKRAILAALRALSIASVEISYDGEGDSGQLGDVVATDKEGKPATVRGYVRATLQGSQGKYALCEALHLFTWDVLCAFHAAFENNEGGFGTLRIDVLNRRVILDHNDRIVEVSNTETEV